MVEAAGVELETASSPHGLMARELWSQAMYSALDEKDQSSAMTSAHPEVWDGSPVARAKRSWASLARYTGPRGGPRDLTLR
jgi:hypothetical protein